MPEVELLSSFAAPTPSQLWWGLPDNYCVSPKAALMRIDQPRVVQYSIERVDQIIIYSLQFIVRHLISERYL